MRKEERVKIIEELKEEINARLLDLDFNRLKDLLLWLAKSQEYQSLKEKDVQLQILHFFTEVKLQELKKRESFAMQGDVFEGIGSLEDAERKYLAAKFAILRIENDMPYEYCMESSEQLIQYQYSPYALGGIIIKESKEQEKNFLGLTRLFREKNDLIRAIGLLEKGVEKYPGSEMLLCELAEIWLEAQQWDKAYQCLCDILNPNQDIQELKQELEKVIGDEGV